MSNPFNFGVPVSPDKMVGRWKQVEAIVHDLINSGGHSHIVIGGRRFGKSSLLEALQYSLTQQIHQTKQAKGDWYVVPIPVNLQRLTKSSPEGVFGLIANTVYKYFEFPHYKKLLDDPFDVNLEHTRLHLLGKNGQKECSLDEFSEIIDELLDVFSTSRLLLRLVFLLDEIEVALDKDWTEILFGQLRSLIYEGVLRNYIRYVIGGSSRVIDVRDQGSPLLNMLKINYLEALRREDIMTIINWTSDVPPDVTEAVIEQSGGHPFIAQYLMYHLWEQGIANTKRQSVEELASRFFHERYADLDQWLVDIGQTGQFVYRYLAESNYWVTEAEVRKNINTANVKIGYGLITLCYHGLVIQDGTWNTYQFSGHLFKRWFQNNIAPSLAGLSTASPQSSLYSVSDISSQYIKSNIPKLPRTDAFVSYSHKDRKYLLQLQTHLTPYLKQEVLNVWDDTKIPYGSNWNEEIEKALQSAKVAVLLISPDFLASDFIMNYEVPLLLAAQQEGITILSVILRPCAFKNSALAHLHSVNNPTNPLINMTRGKRDEEWSKVAELIRDALG